MPRRGYEERPVATGVASFDAPTPPPGANLAPLEFGGIQRAVQGLLTRELQREDERAFEAGREAQLAADPSEPVTESGRVRRRVVEAWERGRDSVLSEQIKVEATRTANELAREHRNNPEGFSSAWESYSKGLSENLRTTSPALANDVTVSLQQYGATAFENLVQNQFNRELQMQGQLVLDTINSRIAVFEDTVLANPDEQIRRNALDEIRMVAQAEFEAGLITAEQASSLVRSAQQRLSTSYYRGQFTQALEGDNPDFAGAQAVIDALQRGEGFEDNEQGRRLASNLAQNLRAAMGGESMSEQVSLAMDNLKDHRENVRLGVDLSPETMAQVEAQTRFVMEHGTLLQRKNAVQEFQNILNLGQFTEWIDNAPMAALTEVDDTSFAGFSREVRTSLIERLRRRHDDLRDLAREGNELKAHGELSWRSSPDEIAGRHEMAERTYGRSLMNIWTAAEVRANAGEFNEALSNGDIAEAQAVADGTIGALANPSQQIHEALRLGTAAGPAAIYSLLSTANAPLEASQALRYMGIGRNVEEGTASLLSRFGLRADDITGNSEFQEIALAMAGGDPNLANRFLSSFVDMYAGRFADMELRGENPLGGFSGRRQGRQDLLRILEPFTDVVRFDDGTTMPAFYLGNQRLERREVERRVNAFYQNPREFGYGMDITENLRELTSPRVMANGQIGIYSFVPDVTGRAGFLTDTEGNPISIDQEAAARLVRQQEVKAARQEAEHEAVFGRPVGITATEAFDNLSNRISSLALGSLASTAADRLGTRADVLTAIHNTGLSMNPADVGPRVHFMLTADSVTESNWGRVRDAIDPRVYAGDRNGAINSPDASAFLAADRLAQAEASYPNDLEAQLSAYWMGFEAFQEYKRNAGDNWFRDLPLPAKKFIENVKQRLD